jgi:hypothetical protein
MIGPVGGKLGANIILMATIREKGDKKWKRVEES